jgi:hypothetical protein
MDILFVMPDIQILLNLLNINYFGTNDQKPEQCLLKTQLEQFFEEKTIPSVSFNLQADE